MAAAPTWHNESKRFIDVLDSLGSEICCNSYSRRGKRQAEEVDRFKRAICANEWQEELQRFCKDLFQRINRCIAKPAASVDLRLFYAVKARRSLILAVLHTTGNDGELEDATAAGNNETDLPWTHKSNLPSTNDSTWVMLTGENPFGIPLVRRR